MTSKVSSLQEHELRTFLEASRSVLRQAANRTPDGLGFITMSVDATQGRVDTRTLAASVITLGELSDYRSARDICCFLLSVQHPSGAWTQSYTPDGNEAATSYDEDVTALSLWALMSYVRASGDEAFAEQARGQVDRAVLYCRERTLNPYLNLVETNGSIHGQEVSVGYELWNNCAHAAAFALCHRVYGGRRYRRLALLIRRSIGVLMTADGRFLRRLDSNGDPDQRPDICVLAPYYFRLWAPGERYVMNSADLVEKTLWNIEIGGYIRLLPFSTTERSIPFGPSPLFTAWVAQYHYEQGNKDRAEAIMRWIFDQSVNGRLPEVVVPTVSAGRYLTEQRRAAVDGGESHVDSWRHHRLADLEAVEEALGQREIVPLGVPSVWAHLEALRALRKGGLVQDWKLFD